MKRIILYIIAVLILIVLALYIIWDNRSVFNNQPILSNKEYFPVLDSIKTIKEKLLKQNANKNVLEKEFIDLMSNRIFPYWYGTKWDFYGTTQIPNKGNIACGYFVTTTLRDIGVPINRIKMAQCASEQMIKSLTSPDNIYKFSNLDITKFETRLKKIGNGLYIVGLDNHTGFLLLSSSGNYFIHSSGRFPFQVVKEKLSDSPMLIQSNYRVVGKISSDNRFITKWINN